MNFIPCWIRDNFRVKLGLFILATLLWFLVVSQRSYEHSLTIPIQITGLKSGKLIVSEIPEEAKVTFHAQGRELMRMQFYTRPYLRIDLSTISRFYTFRPHLDMVVVPGGLDAKPIDVISPDSIFIKLDDKLELALPVSPRITAVSAAGYTFVGDFEIKPPEATIIGPRSQVVRLDSLETEAVELGKVKRNTVLDLDIILPANVYGARIIPLQVKALIRVERLGESKINQVPIRVINTPRGREVVIDPVSVDVEVTGGISNISNINADSIRAWVDFREYNMTKGGRAPVHIETSLNVGVRGITPENVRLIIRRK
ncbi:MAG: hypothetical protein P9X24_16095 [Candidatus Hatepunaea meridiana]|nr:hypothetical protein [Candidatus Hatepunaea meridiana]